MTLFEALQPIAAYRGPRIVIPTMASVGEWPQLSDTALDFAYMPSSMGQGASIGLGLALAQPERGVIVLCGEGSLLMNLGCLVTIASYPANYYLVILDNQLYEVTGGQPTVGAGRINFAEIARGSGIGRVYSFDDAETWQHNAKEALHGTGPVVIWLRLEGRLGKKTPKPPRPMSEQIERLREALHSNV